MPRYYAKVWWLDGDGAAPQWRVMRIGPFASFEEASMLLNIGAVRGRRW